MLTANQLPVEVTKNLVSVPAYVYIVHFNEDVTAFNCCGVCICELFKPTFKALAFFFFAGSFLLSALLQKRFITSAFSAVRNLFIAEFQNVSNCIWNFVPAFHSKNQLRKALFACNGIKKV